MRILHIAFIVAFSLATERHVSGQGFINLNFDQSTIVSSNPTGYGFNTGTAKVPGWTAYYGWGAVNYSAGTTLVYNNQPLDDPGVSLEGTDYFTPGIQGKYSVLLQSSSSTDSGNHNSASIGQTGLIPSSAKSINYWESTYDEGALQVTFNGQLLVFTDVGDTANYSIWSANISAYAGQSGQLLFTAPYESVGMLDNIQFSALQAPEPSTWELLLCGASLFGLAKCYANSRIKV